MEKAQRRPLTQPLEPGGAAGQQAWDAAQRVLCIRLDALGDVLMTTPAIRALKAGHPQRRITLMTSPAGASAAPLIPEVDDVIVYDAPWVKATHTRSNSIPEYRMMGELRQANFDAAVIFTVFSQNPLPAAFMAYLAGIPLRLAHCRENPYQLLSDWVPETDLWPDENLRHEVRRHLDLVATVGCSTEDERLSLQPGEWAYHQAGRVLQDRGIDVDRPWVIIHPGASAPSRRYRPDGFAQAADLLARQGLQIVLSGTQPERELVAQIQEQMQAPAVSLAGDLNLEEFGALVSLAPLIIANNSGPAHVAAAVGTPVVDLYALTNPQHTPWQVPHRVLYQDVPCKYCFKSVCPMGHHNCLRLVTPEQVAQAALSLLEETQLQAKEKVV